jgi:hypothetical protein
MVTGYGKILEVHVDAETLERLEWYARERDTYGPNARTVEDLAEAAVAEAALKADTRP